MFLELLKIQFSTAVNILLLDFVYKRLHHERSAPSHASSIAMLLQRTVDCHHRIIQCAHMDIKKLCKQKHERFNLYFHTVQFPIQSMPWETSHNSMKTVQ